MLAIAHAAFPQGDLETPPNRRNLPSQGADPLCLDVITAEPWEKYE